MKKIVSKGYTIEVLSWENDGDYYNTKSVTVQSKECAKAIYKLCTELFGTISRNRGIGNITNGEEADSILKKWINDNSHSLEILNIEYFENTKNLEEISFFGKIDLIMEINYDLLGGSEFYYSRVCEKCEVFYSNIDLFVEEVNFD